MPVAEAFEHERRVSFRDPHWVVEIYLPVCGWIVVSDSNGKMRTFSTQREAENYRL